MSLEDYPSCAKDRTGTGHRWMPLGCLCQRVIISKFPISNPTESHGHQLIIDCPCDLSPFLCFVFFVLIYQAKLSEKRAICIPLAVLFSPPTSPAVARQPSWIAFYSLILQLSGIR